MFHIKNGYLVIIDCKFCEGGNFGLYLITTIFPFLRTMPGRWINKKGKLLERPFVTENETKAYNMWIST